MYLVPGGYLVWGGTLSRGDVVREVYLVPGGVPGPRGVYLVLGGVPGPGGCTWSQGAAWSGTPPL